MAGISPDHLWNIEIVRIPRGLHPNNFPSSRASDTNANRRVVRSRKWIRILERLWIRTCAGIRNSSDDLAARRAKIVDQRVVSHAIGVELPESNGAAIGTPFEPIADIKLFFIHPVGSAVDDRVRAVA